MTHNFFAPWFAHHDCIFLYIFKLLSTIVGILLYSSKGILYMGGNAYVTGCVYQAINKKIKKNTKINPYGVNEPYQWPTTFYITLSSPP